MKIRRTQIRTSNRIEINFLLPLTIRLNKSLANIPDKLSDWNIETIERLLSILSMRERLLTLKEIFSNRIMNFITTFVLCLIH